MGDRVTRQEDATVAQYMWDDVAEQGTREARRGRVRLRPNRGFTDCLACDVTPQESIVRADYGF